MFWTFLLFGFCLVMAISAVKYGKKNAFAFAGFVAIVGSIFLMMVELMSNWIGFLFIIVGAISIAVLVGSKES